MTRDGSGPRRRESPRPGSPAPGGEAEAAAAGDPKAFARTVGQAVRRARQTLGWTQAELAANAGLSPNYIARLERGELGPSLFVAQKLCTALGIDLSELLRNPAAPAAAMQRGAAPRLHAAQKTARRRPRIAG